VAAYAFEKSVMN